MKSYTIQSHNTVTGDTPFQILHTMLIHDKSDFNTEFDEAKQAEYLKAAHELFLLKSANINNIHAHISDADEKELHFMLEAILHARKALYEHVHEA